MFSLVDWTISAPHTQSAIGHYKNQIMRHLREKKGNWLKEGSNLFLLM